MLLVHHEGPSLPAAYAEAPPAKPVEPPLDHALVLRECVSADRLYRRRVAAENPEPDRPAIREQHLNQCRAEAALASNGRRLEMVIAGNCTRRDNGDYHAWLAFPRHIGDGGGRPGMGQDGAAAAR